MNEIHYGSNEKKKCYLREKIKRMTKSTRIEVTEEDIRNKNNGRTLVNDDNLSVYEKQPKVKR